MLRCGPQAWWAFMLKVLPHKLALSCWTRLFQAADCLRCSGPGLAAGPSSVASPHDFFAIPLIDTCMVPSVSIHPASGGQCIGWAGWLVPTHLCPCTPSI
jgi:hypothetical protein